MVPFMCILAASSSARAAVPIHLWSYNSGGSNPDAGWGVATDVAGNVVITGQFSGSASFGGKVLTGVGYVDVFVAKYDANGVYKWSKRFGSPFNLAIGYAVAVDGTGDVVVMGAFQGKVDFGGGPFTSTGTDIFVAKFDANGVHQWSQHFPSSTSYASVYSVAIDGPGNVILAGTFQGTVDFGGGPLISAGGEDIFVVSFDANGAHQWSKRFGSAGHDYSDGVAVDAMGNIVVTGAFRLAVSFGGSTLTSAGGSDIFVAKYNAGGVHQWSKRFGSTSEDVGGGVAVDMPGNVAVTGSFRGAVSFGGSTLTSAGGSDIFVAKYAANGVHQWSRRFGSTGSDGGSGIGVDAPGNVAVTGGFEGTVNFDGGPLVSSGGADIFLARYDASGGHQWSRAFGGDTVFDNCYGLAVDGLGSFAITGSFNGTVDFGGGGLTSEGWDDIFVAKFGEESPVPVLFTNFTATPRGSAVEVAWDVWSDDPLGDFTLYRRDETATQTRVVATGSALAAHSHVDAAVEAGKTYHYELVIHTADGSVFRSPEVTVTVAALAGGLEQNQPNPFNPTTAITYTLAERAVTAISVYNAAGERVVRLDEGEHAAGTHRVEWDGRDAAGRAVASGVYVYRVEGVSGVGARKMVLLK